MIQKIEKIKRIRKHGFAGMLTQRFTTVLPNGTEKTTTHPIGFSSKRTSTTEEKYKPFILEFAALKHSLDKFSDIIWGYPVELETDCQITYSAPLSTPHMPGGGTPFSLTTSLTCVTDLDA